MLSIISKQKSAHWISRFSIYLFLYVIGFIFLYPIISIVSSSGKDMLGLYDPRVRWIPTTFVFQNYKDALDALGGITIFYRTVLIMGSTALAQTVSAAVIGYGFAKATFKGHSILFTVMIATFMIPQYMTMLPRYVLYSNYQWIGSVYPLIIPALLGQGTKHAIFILVFYQFYKLSPPSLDEAAAIDGAGNFRIFYKINLRLAVPAAITTFVLALVWNWNEVDNNRTYLGPKLKTLPIAMQDIQNRPWTAIYGNDASTMLDMAFHLGLQSAAIIISILPLICVYILFERRLVEGIDMTGITGE